MDVVQIDGCVNSPNQAAEFSPGGVPMHGVKQRMGRRRVRGVREHTVYTTKNRHLQAVVGMVPLVRWGRILDTVPQKGSATGIRDGVQGYQRVQRVRPYMFRSLSRNSLTGPDVRRHPDGQRPSVSARPPPGLGNKYNQIQMLWFCKIESELHI